MDNRPTTAIALSGALSRALGLADAARSANGALVPAGVRSALPELKYRVDRATGEVILPVAPTLPALPDELAPGMRVALADSAPPLRRDEDGRVVWTPPKAPRMVAPRSTREAARAYAEGVERLLSVRAEPKLIEDWLGRWGPICIQRKTADYETWEKAVIAAVRDVAGFAFNLDTLGLCAARFRYSPTPAEVVDLLAEWLAPFRDALVAAQRVADAREPELKAREAAPGPVVHRTPEELEAMRAYAAARVAEMKADMAARAKAERAARPAAPTTFILTPVDRARALIHAVVLAGHGTDEGRRMQRRLDLFIDAYPGMDEARMIERRRREAAMKLEAGTIDGAQHQAIEGELDGIERRYAIERTQLAPWRTPREEQAA